MILYGLPKLDMLFLPLTNAGSVNAKVFTDFFVCKTKQGKA
jgi:hypothetical protein